eukprot:TRINITY_DN53663_c0_g1_i1.p1 TRINITY_DN53663_c0_g1~~TRINITY_DN53663_c0_g1_i1.p1  ORF type:complete len:151 (-),score=8.83 TRINITY_DN53663_c0_g1_i1:350-802(-)
MASQQHSLDRMVQRQVRDWHDKLLIDQRLRQKDLEIKSQRNGRLTLQREEAVRQKKLRNLAMVQRVDQNREVVQQQKAQKQHEQMQRSQQRANAVYHNTMLMKEIAGHQKAVEMDKANRAAMRRQQALEAGRLLQDQMRWKYAGPFPPGV